MPLPRSRRAALAALALAASPLSGPAEAHRAWMLPSATVLSGDDAWVTVDAAISNDLFYFEHFPMRLDGLTVTGPDGKPVPVQNGNTGKYRSTFDLHLDKPGTYRASVVQSAVFASYKLNGEPKRWRGAPENLEKEVPREAEGLQVTQSQQRTEVFVTAGKPSEAALEPGTTGLALRPVTHPNSLVSGEEARFVLLLDGKPAADVEVEAVPGGIRYRDKLNEIRLRTGADGSFAVTWPAPGMYWLSASVQDAKATLPNARRRATYNATLEVLPP